MTLSSHQYSDANYTSSWGLNSSHQQPFIPKQMEQQSRLTAPSAKSWEQSSRTTRRIEQSNAQWSSLCWIAMSAWQQDLLHSSWTIGIYSSCFIVSLPSLIQHRVAPVTQHQIQGCQTVCSSSKMEHHGNPHPWCNHWALCQADVSSK